MIFFFLGKHILFLHVLLWSINKTYFSITWCNFFMHWNFNKQDNFRKESDYIFLCTIFFKITISDLANRKSIQLFPDSSSGIVSDSSESQNKLKKAPLSLGQKVGAFNINSSSSSFLIQPSNLLTRVITTLLSTVGSNTAYSSYPVVI